MRETETNDSRTPLQHPSDEQDTTKETDAGHNKNDKSKSITSTKYHKEAKNKTKNDNKKHHNSTDTNAPHQESGNMFLGDIKHRHT